MIYSSYEFLLVLPLLVTLFYAMRTERAQLILLLVASAIFLAWPTPWNLLPVTIVITVVYGYLVVNDRIHPRRWALALVVFFVVAQLAYFRYRGFIADSFGLRLPVPSLISWLIPLGISFYSFEAISAAVDLYRKPQRVRLVTWSIFIMFLPHLIAGPIVRYRQLVPQFSGRKKLLMRNFAIGINFFAIGFVKKLIADQAGFTVDPVWAAPSQASRLALALALLGFFAQLYLDFSGYTDMGRGVARMLGYRLPLNFRGPAFSVTPSEFYQRWHVSLSSWIRTFVYDTLAVAVLRRVKSRSLQNYALLVVVLVVMAIFGLWHGSSWHFVLFGIAQGVVIVAWQAFNRGRVPLTLAGKVVSGLLLQATWLFSLVLFRADDLTKVGSYLGGFVVPGSWTAAGLQWCLAGLAATLVFQAVEYLVRRRPLARTLIFLRATPFGMAISLTVFMIALGVKVTVDLHQPTVGSASIGTAGFIYFRF